MNKYTTEDLVEWAKKLCTWDMVSDTSIRDAIIDKLRAGEKLCEDIKAVYEILQNPFPPEVLWVDERPQLANLVRKAIADYEGKP